jgi:hypothetical protein
LSSPEVFQSFYLRKGFSLQGGKIMRKLIYGALAMATALTITAGVNSQKAAAEVKASVNLETQTMTVEGTTQISVAFPSVKVASDKVTLAVTSKSWDVYQAGTPDTSGNVSVTVDLSKLNPSKTGYVAVKDESGDAPKLLVFEADSRKLSGVYNAPVKDTNGDEVASITIKSNKAALTDGDAKDFNYRTSYGSWDVLTNSDGSCEADLTPYIQEGAQFIVRSKGVKYTGEDTTGGYKLDATKSDTTYTIEKVGTLPSKEFKVKVAALASAPKVTKNYTKNEFKLASKVEYRLDYTGGWTTADSKVLSLDTIGTSAKVLQVRTVEDASKKKAASKITSVDIGTPGVAPDVITAEEGKTVLQTLQEKASTTDGVNILKSETDKIIAKIESKKSKLTITNNTSKSIDIIAVTGTSEKITTIKKTKSATIAYNASTELSVRYSGVAKKTTETPDLAWASVPAPLGKMVEYKAATDPGTGNGNNNKTVSAFKVTLADFLTSGSINKTFVSSIKVGGEEKIDATDIQIAEGTEVVVTIKTSVSSSAYFDGLETQPTGTTNADNELYTDYKFSMPANAVSLAEKPAA